MTLNNDNSSSKFGFDLCANRSQNAADFFSLGKRGFNLSPLEREHPGSNHCRFIHFNNPNPLSLSKQGNRQYLEFCEVKDLEAAKNYYASLGAHEEEYRSCMFYLSCSIDLEGIYKKHKDSHAPFGINFLHKNYDWKNDSQSRLPGWNFLTFNAALVRSLQCAFAEYEPTENYQEQPQDLTTHPNGAHSISGAIWSVESPTDTNPLCEILGKDKGESIVLDDGFRIWLRTDVELQSLGLASKKTSFRAIILGCKNIEEYIATAKPDVVIDFYGKKAALIRYGEMMWDILAIEEKSSSL